MMPTPRWYWIPARVLLITFLLTLMSFAFSLLLAIIGLEITARIRGVSADVALAYRQIAPPIAGITAVIVMISAAVIEIRHYREAKILASIERSSS